MIIVIGPNRSNGSSPCRGLLSSDTRSESAQRALVPERERGDNFSQ